MRFLCVVIVCIVMGFLSIIHMHAPSQYIEYCDEIPDVYEIPKDCHKIPNSHSHACG